MTLKLEIPHSVYKEIMFYVNESDVEISGLGTCSFDKPTGLFKVHKIVLCEQENGPATTDLDAKSITKAMHELRLEPHDLKFWWHSHVNMPVFWSGTDKATMAELGEHGWFLSTVFNKKAELKTCVTFPTEFGLYEVDAIDTTITDMPQPQEPPEYAGYRANMKARCTEKKFYAAPRGRVPMYPKPDWAVQKSHQLGFGMTGNDDMADYDTYEGYPVLRSSPPPFVKKRTKPVLEMDYREAYAYLEELQARFDYIGQLYGEQLKDYEQLSEDFGGIFTPKELKDIQ